MVRGVGLMSSKETYVVSTFDKRYPPFLVLNYTRYVAVRTLLLGLSTIDKWYQEGMFDTNNELERYIKNARTQLLAEIRFDLQGKMKNLA